MSYKQLLLSNINTTSFIHIPKQLSQKDLIKYDLIERLKTKGYFTEEAERWIYRIKNCLLDSTDVRAFYSCGDHLDFQIGCNSRLCERCMKKYRSKVKKRIRFIISRMKRIRTVTISPKNYTVKEFNSGFALKDISKIWARLRKEVNKYSEYSFGDFVAVKEFKFNKKGSPVKSRKTGKPLKHKFHEQDNWNIHMHIVYDGSFIPQRLLSDLMFRITKGKSKYIYINAVKDYVGFGVTKTVRYLSKYIGKFEVSGTDPNVVADFYMVTKNKKFVTYSHNFDKVEYKKYLLACPKCYEGHITEMFMVGHKRLYNGEMERFQFEIIIKYDEIISKLQDDQQVLDSEDKLLKKIDVYLQNDLDNCEVVESVLSKKELEYLLNIGAIYQPTASRYDKLV